MRVPPDQSSTLAEQAASASSGSFSLQRARDVGQPRAEQEGVHALARVGDGMEEMQEQPRVLAHRAGNIEQRDDRRLPSSRGPRYFRSISAPPAFMLARKRAAHDR